MKRRAFTLIEILIVATLLLILMAPFLAQYVSMEREFSRLALDLDLKTEAQLLVGQVLRRGPARLAPDNHRLDFRDGSAIRWDGSQLWLKAGSQPERRLNHLPVTEFAAVRTGKELLLTVTVHSDRAPQEYRTVSRR